MVWQQLRPQHCSEWNVRVFMGKEDTEQTGAECISEWSLLGAKVHAVTSGTQTLKDAVNETLREWTNRI